MGRKQEFERLVTSGLARFRERAIDRMRHILGRSLPPEARVLWFEIQSSIWGLSVYVFAMDEMAVNEAFTQDPKTDQLRAIVSEDLVPDEEEAYISHEVIDEYDDDVPVGSYEYAARLIAEFVRTCYLKAGGEAHPLRAYAHHHDRGVALNLKTGEWVHTEKIHEGRA